MRPLAPLWRPRLVTPTLSRRSLLALSGAGIAGLPLLPLLSPARADSTTPERRFLFVHCYGGWDTTYVFQPNFGSDIVDMEPDATASEANGIAFVDSASRPNVRNFLEEWGGQVCVVNGVEVRSVTHERCSRIVMTGSAEGATDDWGATIAGNADPAPLLPYLVFSGRAFTAQYTDRVVRIGRNGQLDELLSGEALARADAGTPAPSELRGDAVEAFVRARHDAFAGESPIAASGARALADVAALRRYSGELDIAAFPTGCQQLANQLGTVWDTFELGLARSALVEYRGWCNTTWDTHADNFMQGQHFEELFEHLGLALADLATRTDTDGAPLSERVTIVVLSEMGRTPQLGEAGGRDHWTFTSAMLVGAGVAGGRVIGGYDTSGYGTGADYATGEIVTDGTGIMAANLGATVLALADVDPGENAPLTAALA